MSQSMNNGCSKGSQALAAQQALTRQQPTMVSLHHHSVVHYTIIQWYNPTDPKAATCALNHMPSEVSSAISHPENVDNNLSV
jgi:hypothetical protein